MATGNGTLKGKVVAITGGGTGHIPGHKGGVLWLPETGR
jgi:hypothetical protein